MLGSVEGLACKRNLYASGAPSVEEARQGVKIRAAQLGANAVINMLCEQNQKVDWIRNCWQSVVCVGDAIIIDDPDIPTTLKKDGEPKSAKTVSHGTGWVVEPGFIITNHHVVDNATEIVGHFNDGRTLKLSIVGDDPVNDIALLLPPANTPLPQSIPLAKNQANVGEEVFTIGFPHTEILGSNVKVTNGYYQTLLVVPEVCPEGTAAKKSGLAPLVFFTPLCAADAQLAHSPAQSTGVNS